VTHSISEAIFLADRVVVMSRRPGFVKKTVPIELDRPRHREMFTSEQFRDYERNLKATIWEEIA
jgi:NitT/TauT family transport system ATP-binding protein